MTNNSLMVQAPDLSVESIQNPISKICREQLRSQKIQLTNIINVVGAHSL